MKAWMSFHGCETADGSVWLSAVVGSLGAGAALLAGYGVATDNLLLAGLPLAVVAGLLLSAYPRLVLWSMFLLGLVVAGAVRLYVPSLAAVRWAAVPLGLLLAAYAILVYLGAGQRAPERVPALLYAVGAVVVALTLSTVANLPEPLQMVRGFKGYFQAWGLLAALAVMAWPEALMRRQLPLALLAVGLLQLPFALHQFLVLVPKRAALDRKGLVPEDVVGGTFGAEALGGGSNAMLAIYAFVLAAGLVGLWQRDAIRGRFAILLGLLLMLPLLLNQAKASVVYLLVLCVVMFSRDIAARPLRSLAAVGLAAVLGAGMLSAYTAGTADSQVQSWADLLRATYQSNIEADQQSRGSFTRAGALRYWADLHLPADPLGALLGHGLYESRTGAEGADALWDNADRSLGIKNTAVSAILWDAGLIGLAAVFGLLAVAYRCAGDLAIRHSGDPWLSGLFLGGRGAIAILFTSLWLKSYFSYHLAYQTLFALLIGWLAYWQSRGGPSAAGTAPPDARRARTAGCGPGPAASDGSK